MEDYGVLCFGPAVFKVARLFFSAFLGVHLFACAFFRVKRDSAASQDDVNNFYLSRNVDPNVSAVQSDDDRLIQLSSCVVKTDLRALLCWHDLAGSTRCICECPPQSLHSRSWACCSVNACGSFILIAIELSSSTHTAKQRLIAILNGRFTVRLAWMQLVCFYFVFTTLYTIGYGTP